MWKFQNSTKEKRRITQTALHKPFKIRNHIINLRERAQSTSGNNLSLLNTSSEQSRNNGNMTLSTPITLHSPNKYEVSRFIFLDISSLSLIFLITVNICLSASSSLPWSGLWMSRKTEKAEEYMSVRSVQTCNLIKRECSYSLKSLKLKTSIQNCAFLRLELSYLEQYSL